MSKFYRWTYILLLIGNCLILEPSYKLPNLAVFLPMGSILWIAWVLA